MLESLVSKARLLDTDGWMYSMGLTLLNDAAADYFSSHIDDLVGGTISTPSTATAHDPVLDVPVWVLVLLVLF